MALAAASSDTQGQIVGRAENWGERKMTAEGAGAGRKELFYPLLLFSTICPWISGDVAAGGAYRMNSLLNSPQISTGETKQHQEQGSDFRIPIQFSGP